jgi:hypothetical protein
MKISPILLGLSLAVAGSAMAAAQDASAKPPAVIVIAREWLKTGISFPGHDRAGANFTSISARAKQQGHTVALDNMSGKSRSLYITRYPSFEAWEKDNNLIYSNAALSTEMFHAIQAEGEYAEGIDFGVFTYNEDWSFHPRPDLSHARYYELSSFRIRPGHRKDFNDCVKMVKEGNEKAGTAAHWGAYEIAYGGEDGTVIALTHRESLKEVDQSITEGKKFAAAMGGEDGMRKLDEVCGQGIESSHTELFSINPKQSYPDEQWIKGDPDFWKPKAEAAVKSTKPATAAAAKPISAPAVPKPASR